jgi:hypothetical protein
VFKDDFKHMVNNEIGLGGEQEIIAKRLECLRDDADCEGSIYNCNDAHSWVHRPNILVK